MIIKDYYTILHLSPGADFDAVKRAYRQLAMEYHPDRNRGNAYAAAHFQEIKEAYDVLSDYHKREAYHQQRALWKASGKTFAKEGPVTPVRILQQALRLSEKVREMDAFRMDHEALYLEIMQLASDEVIDRLASFHDDSACEQIARFLLDAAKPLPYRLALLIGPRMQKLAGKNAPLPEVTAFLKKKQREQFVDTYMTPVLIVMALILCYLVYKLSS